MVASYSIKTETVEKFYKLNENIKFYPVFREWAFEAEVLLGVCWFVIDICEDLAIYGFYKDV